MNPVSYALQKVRLAIPEPILRAAFIGQDRSMYRSAVSLDTLIRQKVIENTVLVDCNLMGGAETTIDLSLVQWEQIDEYNAIIRVPKSVTNGRTIIRALGVTYGNVPRIISNTAYSKVRSSAMLDAASSMLQSSLPVPYVESADLEIIAENTIYIRDGVSHNNYSKLTCWLELDSNMNHIQPTSYPAFSKLVIYAVKAYVYNNLLIEMDRNMLVGGQDLNSFRSVVEGYSDAYENYSDYLTKTWKKTALLNDGEARRGHLRTIMGGNF